MCSVLNDLRFAWRMWRANPVPITAGVLTLALGVGANTAIFTVIHAVMLKPLPYPQSQRLVQIWSVDLDPNSDLRAMMHRDKQIAPAPELDRLRELTRSFSEIGYYRPWLVNFTAPGEPERVTAALVSAGLFPALGVNPARGRSFTASDLVSGSGRVILLSDGFWRRRFAADAAVLGRTPTIDGYPCTVIGVLPPDFRLIAASISEQPEIYEPISMLTGASQAPEPGFAIGRLRPGIGLKAAQDELAALRKQLPHPEGPRGVNLVRLDEEVASGIRPALLMLFAAAGCVLLIACGNIANLIFAATAARQKELALRNALGASRGRLIQQILTESVALSLAGAAAGLLISVWAVHAIVNFYPHRIPRLESLNPEPAVFAFCASLALTIAVLSGTLPALRYSRLDIQQAINGTCGPGGSRGSAWFRDLLTAVQVASALVLFCGAGLLLRSFLLMRAIDPGYQRHNLLVAHLMLDDKTYGDPARQAKFVQRLLQRLRELPAVEMAGATNSLPLEFNFLMSLTLGIEGHPELGNNEEVDCRSVTPYFLETMGIGLLAGRYLEPADSAPNGGALVNRAFARRYFGEGNPVGRHLFLDKASRSIVGVIPDIRNLHLDRPPVPEIYMPFDRQPAPFVDLAVRTAADPKFLVNAVRAALRKVDPNQPLGKVTTMDNVLKAALSAPRWYAILTGCFAGLALLLASVGIYGVIAYSVSQRTSEIGIRMAIGAQRADVLRMVLLRGMRAPLAGVGIGLAAALPASRVLESFLYGIRPLDPRTYVLAALVVLVVALSAAWSPARRASAIDPMKALRRE